MLAPTMWELRRSPTLNIRQSLSSLREMTACLENTRVSARLLGCEIFTNMQPTWKDMRTGGEKMEPGTFAQTGKALLVNEWYLLLFIIYN